MDSAPTTRPPSPRRPKYVDLNLLHLPAAGLVSILHRVSGALLFFPVLPALLYVFQASLGSEAAYAECREFFARPLVKLVALALVWAYAHHFFAGLRYLLLDVHIGVAKAPSRVSAGIVLALGLIATLAIGWCVW